MKTAMVAIGFLAAAAGAEGATAVECPSTLKITSSVQVPVGWEQVSQGLESILVGVSVYDGHPSQEANLAPRNLPSKGGFEVAQWGVGDGSWLLCHYSGTYVTLAKPIPKDFKSCKAYYKHRKYGLGPFAKFECE